VETRGTLCFETVKAAIAGCSAYTYPAVEMHKMSGTLGYGNEEESETESSKRITWCKVLM